MRVINTLLVIAILLFAAVMGWTFFTVRGDQVYQPGTGIGGGPGITNDSRSNFHTSFQTLLSQHGNLAATHLSNLYDGKDTSGTSKKLEENAQQLGDVFKQLGTAADRELFLQSFRGHIREYENYTKGRKANNQAQMNLAKENLHMHAMDFGNITHKLMPTISETHGTELMSEHVNLTIAIIDAHAKGDTVKKLNEMKNATAQAVQFGEELANGADAANK